MVNRALYYLQRTLHGPVKHGHGIAEPSGVFQPFQNRSQALEGRVVVEQQWNRTGFAGMRDDIKEELQAFLA